MGLSYSDIWGAAQTAAMCTDHFTADEGSFAANYGPPDSNDPITTEQFLRILSDHSIYDIYAFDGATTDKTMSYPSLLPSLECLVRNKQEQEGVVATQPLRESIADVLGLHLSDLIQLSKERQLDLPNIVRQLVAFAASFPDRERFEAGVNAWQYDAQLAGLMTKFTHWGRLLAINQPGAEYEAIWNAVLRGEVNARTLQSFSEGFQPANDIDLAILQGRHQIGLIGIALMGDLNFEQIVGKLRAALQLDSDQYDQDSAQNRINKNDLDFLQRSITRSLDKQSDDNILKISLYLIRKDALKVILANRNWSDNEITELQTLFSGDPAIAQIAENYLAALL